MHSSKFVGLPEPVWLAQYDEYCARRAASQERAKKRHERSTARQPCPIRVLGAEEYQFSERSELKHRIAHRREAMGAFELDGGPLIRAPGMSWGQVFNATIAKGRDGELVNPPITIEQIDAAVADGTTREMFAAYYHACQEVAVAAERAEGGDGIGSSVCSPAESALVSSVTAAVAVCDPCDGWLAGRTGFGVNYPSGCVETSPAPLADRDYTDEYGYCYTRVLKPGAVSAAAMRFGVAPEAEFVFSEVNNDDIDWTAAVRHSLYVAPDGGAYHVAPNGSVGWQFVASMVEILTKVRQMLRGPGEGGGSLVLMDGSRFHRGLRVGGRTDAQAIAVDYDPAWHVGLCYFSILVPEVVAAKVEKHGHAPRAVEILSDLVENEIDWVAAERYQLLATATLDGPLQYCVHDGILTGWVAIASVADVLRSFGGRTVMGKDARGDDNYWVCGDGWEHLMSTASRLGVVPESFAHPMKFLDMPGGASARHEINRNIKDRAMWRADVRFWCFLMSGIDPGFLANLERPPEVASLITDRVSTVSLFGRAYLQPFEPGAHARVMRLCGMRPVMALVAIALVWLGDRDCGPLQISVYNEEDVLLTPRVGKTARKEIGGACVFAQLGELLADGREYRML